MRFIRFSYFIDYLAMSSLKLIYDDSLSECCHTLVSKTEEKDIYLLKEEVKDIKDVRSSVEPIFTLNL